VHRCLTVVSVFGKAGGSLVMVSSGVGRTGVKKVVNPSPRNPLPQGSGLLSLFFPLAHAHAHAHTPLTVSTEYEDQVLLVSVRTSLGNADLAGG
jgi:hypothetical protein